MASEPVQDLRPPFTVVGTPYSTFTRTITLGLTHKGLAFDQVRVVPHSDVAYAHHPFGFLPTLVIRRGPDGETIKLSESQAIVRYIDRIQPTPPLTLDDDNGAGVDLAERLWEFVSIAGAHGFPAIEKGVVKPHVAALDAALPTASIRAASAPGLPALRHFLAQIEAAMVPAPVDAYVFGARLTWADLFLFPLLADLRAIEAELSERVLSARLRAWMERMDGVEAVQRTREGTLSAGARPP